MKKIAVILSGCGFYDGSEIQETVITLLNIARSGASYQCFAPDIEQHDTINHLTGDKVNEKRNVLIESARIARGQIKSLEALEVKNFDAVILPGGFGAAKNLCNFARAGNDFTINTLVSTAIREFASARKPIGLICIAPVMAGKLFNKQVNCTVGNDKEVSKTIEQSGANHIECTAGDIVVDEQNKLVSTPAYMLADCISEVDSGIGKLVHKVIAMT